MIAIWSATNPILRLQITKPPLIRHSCKTCWFKVRRWYVQLELHKFVLLLSNKSLWCLLEWGMSTAGHYFSRRWAGYTSPCPMNPSIITKSSGQPLPCSPPPGRVRVPHVTPSQKRIKNNQTCGPFVWTKLDLVWLAEGIIFMLLSRRVWFMAIWGLNWHLIRRACHNLGRVFATTAIK